MPLYTNQVEDLLIVTRTIEKALDSMPANPTEQMRLMQRVWDNAVHLVDQAEYFLKHNCDGNAEEN